MSQHTPGPWAVEIHHDGVYVVRANAPAAWICRMQGHVPKQIDRDNAALVAFAPDLYDFAYWVGNPRQSYRQRVESVQRRAREILRRMVQATPERSEAS